jgi:hypothetical protein
MRTHRRSLLAVLPWSAGLAILAGCAQTPAVAPPISGTDQGAAASSLEREAIRATMQQPGTSQGVPVITGSSGGDPQIQYRGAPTGNLAPGGMPTVTGSSGGDPQIQYRSAPATGSSGARR